MSTLTFEQIEKLTKEFPFLPGVVQLEPQHKQPKNEFKIKVDVQVADGEMLYTEPHFCLPPHYIGTADNKFVGHRYPSVYVIGHNDLIVRYARWDYDHQGFFIKQVIGDGRDIKAVVLIVHYVMLRNVEDWLERKLDSCVGPFSHHDYRVTIYKAPKQGFAKLVEKAHLTSNVRITDLVGIGLSSLNNLEAQAAINVLEGLVKAFEKNVAPSLWKEVNKCRTHGMSATYAATKMLVYAMAGRVMITFQRGGDQFTVVGLSVKNGC